MARENAPLFKTGALIGTVLTLVTLAALSVFFIAFVTAESMTGYVALLCLKFNLLYMGNFLTWIATYVAYTEEKNRKAPWAEVGFWRGLKEGMRSTLVEFACKFFLWSIMTSGLLFSLIEFLLENLLRWVLGLSFSEQLRASQLYTALHEPYLKVYNKVLATEQFISSTCEYPDFDRVIQAIDSYSPSLFPALSLKHKKILYDNPKKAQFLALYIKGLSRKISMFSKKQSGTRTLARNHIGSD